MKKFRKAPSNFMKMKIYPKKINVFIKMNISNHNYTPKIRGIVNKL